MTSLRVVHRRPGGEPTFPGPAERQLFETAYQAALATWPLPVTACEVQTRWGRTHVNVCGAASGPPVVLLHGFASTSAMWRFTAEALGGTYRLWAPDTLGDAGLSEPEHWPHNRAEYVAWLAELLDGLGLGSANLVGFSYGGWLALALALERPERVRGLALLDPAGIAPLDWRVWLGAMCVAVSHSRRLVTFVGARLNVHYNPCCALDEVYLCGIEFFRRRRWVPPTLFTDDELRRLTAPTLLLWGEHDEALNARRALKRARRLLPAAQAELVPAAGHGAYREQAAWVNTRLTEFLFSLPARQCP